MPTYRWTDRTLKAAPWTCLLSVTCLIIRVSMEDPHQLTLLIHRLISATLGRTLQTFQTFSSIHSQRMRFISLLLLIQILSPSLLFHLLSMHCLRISFSSNRLHFQQTILSKAVRQSSLTTTRLSLPQVNSNCLSKMSISRFSHRCNSSNSNSSSSFNNRTSIDTSRLHQERHPFPCRVISHQLICLRTVLEAFSYLQGSCSTTSMERNSIIQALLCIAEQFLYRHLEAFMEVCKAPPLRALLRIFPYNPL